MSRNSRNIKIIYKSSVKNIYIIFLLKPAILKKIGNNQYGAISNSSTTQALINMVHYWTKYTDETGSTVRVVLFDYRKAFDLIDHTILFRKLLTLDIPYGKTCWVIDFLKNRQQRVKLERECLSEWRNTPARVPQGTKLGPWLFILMIDDIDTVTPNYGNMWTTQPWRIMWSRPKQLQSRMTWMS